MIAPLSVGELISVTPIGRKFLIQKTQIIDAEPEVIEDSSRSFSDGKLHPSTNPKTIADGLLIISLSELTFSIKLNYVNLMLTVKEEAIVNAMELIFNGMKIAVEPSGAVL